jgi:hypothetical protein
MIVDKYGVEVTEERWDKVSLCITEFIHDYPLEWVSFKEDISSLQHDSEYGLALEGGLKDASFRHVLSFPLVARRLSPEDQKMLSKEFEVVASLKDQIEAIIPGFSDDHERNTMKQVNRENRLYYEFQKKFGRLFRPGEKY